MMFARKPAYCRGQVEVARRLVSDERQPTHPHDVICSNRRENVGCIDVGKRGHGDGIGRVQVYHGSGLWPLVVHGAMKKGFLGGWIAGNKVAASVELRKPRGIETTEGNVGRRHEPSVVKPNADISGAAEAQPAGKE